MWKLPKLKWRKIEVWQMMEYGLFTLLPTVALWMIQSNPAIMENIFNISNLAGLGFVIAWYSFTLWTIWFLLPENIRSSKRRLDKEPVLKDGVFQNRMFEKV